MSKSFKGKPVVSDVSFEVHQDETMVLLGTSGSGKTTTLKMINGLISPDQGRVFIDGKDALAQPPEMLRRQVGFVLQNMGLFPHYTVEENISVVPSLLKWDKKRINGRVRELMEKLQLPYHDYASVYPSHLSGGQQQRVGLARALAANPPVLLMDEPFSALDPITRKNIRREFRELDELRNKTIVMVTHDVQEAFDMADRICLMSEGKIIQSGSASEIVFRNQQGFVSQFLGDQQLILELKAVTINAYWDAIETVDQTTQSELKFNASQHLFDILQSLIDVPYQGEAFTIVHTSGEKKITSFSALMQAFRAFKSNYR
nr:ATP-binding cassette domain-containing protein [Cesiribacter sp. SM1]